MEKTQTPEYDLYDKSIYYNIDDLRALPCKIIKNYIGYNLIYLKKLTM